jgi:hypothetical protein
VTQSEIEIPEQPPLPPLPEPPAYWPSTVSKYTRIRLQGRFLCHVCVRLAPDHDLHGPPRRAVYRRKALPTHKAAEQVDLCWEHHRQYLNRDSEARVKAGLPPLKGTG